jgi:hypothetical protein
MDKIMKLFEVSANETGPKSFFIMSDSVENAIKGIKSIPEGDDLDDPDYKDKYTVKEFGENEPAWAENC